MQIKLSEDIYLYENLLSMKKESFIKDIDKQMESGNLCLSVPKYQTYNNLYDILKHKKNWQTLYKNIKEKVLKINPNLKLHSSWANVSKIDTLFGEHTHGTDLTAVFYLKNKFYQFGTILNSSIIIPGKENSLLIFNPKISHQVVNIPLELYEKTGSRYSIVFDFVSTS